MKDEGGSVDDLRTRTKRFGLNAIFLFSRLGRSTVTDVLGRQMLRSATSVGAHYREGCRARSNAEFISKLEGALQELDETTYWLELLMDSGSCNRPDAEALLSEADELIRILVTIVRKRKDG